MSRTRLASWLSGLILLSFLALPSGGLAQSSTWTQVGTFPLGTWSLAAAANGSALYALSNSGIQLSSDQGASWTTCNREARTMFALAPLSDPQAPTMLYATTVNGLRVTEDGCHTWRDVPTNGIAPSASHIRWLAPYPDNYSVLYAGTDGLGGLYRSTDFRRDLAARLKRNARRCMGYLPGGRACPPFSYPRLGPLRRAQPIPRLHIPFNGWRPHLEVLKQRRPRYISRRLRGVESRLERHQPAGSHHP